MGRYMLQFSYSTEAVSDLVKNPQDRTAVGRALEVWPGTPALPKPSFP